MQRKIIISPPGSGKSHQTFTKIVEHIDNSFRNGDDCFICLLLPTKKLIGETTSGLKKIGSRYEQTQKELESPVVYTSETSKSIKTLSGVKLLIMVHSYVEKSVLKIDNYSIYKLIEERIGEVKPENTYLFLDESAEMLDKTREAYYIELERDKAGNLITPGWSERTTAELTETEDTYDIWNISNQKKLGYTLTLKGESTNGKAAKEIFGCPFSIITPGFMNCLELYEEPKTIEEYIQYPESFWKIDKAKYLSITRHLRTDEDLSERLKTFKEATTQVAPTSSDAKTSISKWLQWRVREEISIADDAFVRGIKAPGFGLAEGDEKHLQRHYKQLWIIKRASILKLMDMFEDTTLYFADEPCQIDMDWLINNHFTIEPNKIQTNYFKGDIKVVLVDNQLCIKSDLEVCEPLFEAVKASIKASGATYPNIEKMDKIGQSPSEPIAPLSIVSALLSDTDKPELVAFYDNLKMLQYHTEGTKTSEDCSVLPMGAEYRRADTHPVVSNRWRQNHGLGLWTLSYNNNRPQSVGSNEYADRSCLITSLTTKKPLRAFYATMRQETIDNWLKTHTDLLIQTLFRVIRFGKYKNKLIVVNNCEGYYDRVKEAVDKMFAKILDKEFKITYSHYQMDGGLVEGKKDLTRASNFVQMMINEMCGFIIDKPAFIVDALKEDLETRTDEFIKFVIDLFDPQVPEAVLMSSEYWTAYNSRKEISNIWQSNKVVERSSELLKIKTRRTDGISKMTKWLNVVWNKKTLHKQTDISEAIRITLEGILEEDSQ